MRFLANENIPGDAVSALAAAGHDIIWIRAAAPGSKDEDILAWAAREDRVLLTFDLDFGELAWRTGIADNVRHCAFRMPMPAPGEAGAALAARLGERTDWAGHFSVVQPGRIRMRPLPGNA
jgi:hypothetical protein